MRNRNFSWIKAVFVGCAMIVGAACDDSNEPAGEGDVEFEITDAPIDDANVKSAVVTIADIKVDGQSISGFSKQTIDLKAYQDGNSKLIGNAHMAARTYSNVTLVLDLDTDASGNSPGCYVLSQDNVKYKLKSTTSGKTDIAMNQAWKVASNATTKMVMDFDLRKSIRYSEDPAVRYSFVSESNLNSAVRIVAKDKTGTIKGSYSENSSTNADKIIVYAYKKGTFNASTETQAQGSDAIQFKNAVTSTQVKESLTGKTFTLAYLPAGEYEIHFAAYSRDTTTGKLTFEAMLNSETNVNGAVGDIIKVQANSSINITTVITGAI